LPNDCHLYQKDPTTGALFPTTGNFYVVGYCTSQESRSSFRLGSMPIRRWRRNR